MYVVYLVHQTLAGFIISQKYVVFEPPVPIVPATVTTLPDPPSFSVDLPSNLDIYVNIDVNGSMVEDRFFTY